jgi:hypothetical protein
MKDWRRETWRSRSAETAARRALESMVELRGKCIEEEYQKFVKKTRRDQEKKR